MEKVRRRRRISISIGLFIRAKCSDASKSVGFLGELRMALVILLESEYLGICGRLTKDMIMVAIYPTV